MKYLVVTVAVLLVPFALWGQAFDTEFYPAAEWNYPSTGLESDYHIFTTPAWFAPDPFRMFAKFRFGAVRYRDCGLDGRHSRVMLGAVDLSDNLSSYPDHSLIALARRGGLTQNHTPAMVAGAFPAYSFPAGLGPTESYSLKATGDELYVLLRAHDRHSRAGADVRHSGQWRNGWAHRLAVTGEVGDDAHFRGVRSDGVGTVAAVTKKWLPKTDSTTKPSKNLTFFVAGNISRRGIRTAATTEAFSLTGDPFYNPTWGWQTAKGRRRVRNSRVNDTRQVFAAAEFQTPLGDSRTLEANVAFRHSRSARSRLAWYDATSPMPDYYRKMPSWFPDGAPSGIVTAAWRENDPTVTQVDWDALYYNNTLSPDGRATYIIENQTETANDLHAALDISRRVNKHLTLSYGITFRRDNSRFFKVAADILGAEWVPNVDQYVTDSQTADPASGSDILPAPSSENDLRHPGRKIRRGDRFGYDYSLTRLRPGVHGAVQWHRSTHGLAASASLTHTSFRRNGFYEKALFPGGESFGRSRKSNFTTYSLAASAWWNISPKHSLSLSALASSQPPSAGDTFLSPSQNNRLVAGATVLELYGVEVSWAFRDKNIDMRVTGFLNSSENETEVRQYYDDLASTFSDMVVRGIDRLGFGLEAGIEARLVRWLTLSAGASAGMYRYNSQPTATVFADATGSVISDGIVCYMSGLATGSPRLVAAAEIAYSDHRYWRASVSGEWMGGRHVEINPLYHSARIVGINSAPEIMRAFTLQERLPGAFTLGLSLAKGFVLKRGYLRVAGSVRNVLSSRVIHSGYEQMRILRKGSGSGRTLVPFPSKYLYGYPLTWSVTLSYRI